MYNKLVAKIKKFFPLLITLVFLLIMAYFYEDKVYYIAFVDEQENMIIGHFLAKGEKLYQDLFSNHQPVAYILSSNLQQITNPENLYTLVKKHREFMIAWSVIWVSMLVFRFGWPLIVFSLVYEQLKFFIFGNLFLSESLAVYPLIYLMSCVMFTKNINSSLEILWIGFCLGLSALLLLPIWPLLFLSSILIFLKIKKKISKRLFLLSIGILPLVIISLKYISVGGYLYDPIYINFRYFIPDGGHEPFPGSVIKALITPLISFLPQVETTSMLIAIRVLSVLLILNLFILWRNDQKKKVILLVSLLWLANIRYIEPGKHYYQGFHLIPWFAVLVLICLTTLKKIFIPSKKHLFVALSVLLVVGSSALLYKDHFFIQRDRENDKYINYSRQESYGEIIKAMKQPGDTLFEEEDEYLLFYQAGINHSFFMVDFYPWMWKVPSLRSSREQTFANNPPTFFYCQRCKMDSLIKDFPEYQLVYYFGKPSQLLVLKTRYNSLTKDQKNRLEFFNVSI